MFVGWRFDDTKCLMYLNAFVSLWSDLSWFWEIGVQKLCKSILVVGRIKKWPVNVNNVVNVIKISSANKFLCVRVLTMCLIYPNAFVSLTHLFVKKKLYTTVWTLI